MSGPSTHYVVGMSEWSYSVVFVVMKNQHMYLITNVCIATSMNHNIFTTNSLIFSFYDNFTPEKYAPHGIKPSIFTFLTPEIFTWAYTYGRVRNC